jgi:hypothetical protein
MVAHHGQLSQCVCQQRRLVVAQGGLDGGIERRRRFGERAGAGMGFASGQQLNCPPRLNGAGS